MLFIHIFRPGRRKCQPLRVRKVQRQRIKDKGTKTKDKGTRIKDKE
jgi:hypothetical protein